MQETVIVVLIAVLPITWFCRKFVELFAEDCYNALKKKFSRRKRNNLKVKKFKLSLKKRNSTLKVEIFEIDLNPLK